MGRPAEARQALEQAVDHCPRFGGSEEYTEILGQVERLAAKA